MIIVRVERSASNILVMQLRHLNVKVDPRPSWVEDKTYFEEGKYSFSVNERTLTITRTDRDGGWDHEFFLRVYLPTETIPDFTSTVYTYWGLKDEKAPEDTTEVNFHPSVTTIQEEAFKECWSLNMITIPDHVTHIGTGAFMDSSLKSIRLSINLEIIGDQAFCRSSLEAIYIPPTVTEIGDFAFNGCESLTYFYVQGPIECIGDISFQGCNSLLDTINIKDNNINLGLNGEGDNEEVIQQLMQQHANLPFHQICSSTSITPQGIQGCFQANEIELAMEYDDGYMTALHILCANPHVTADCIRAYLQLAPEAAEQQDFSRKTPFQYLWRKDVTFLEDRSFSSLMAWWYGCMPPQTITGKKRKCE